MKTRLGLPLQVTYPTGLEGPPGSAAVKLRGVIRSCLHSRPQQRPSASQVQVQLHGVIMQQHWSTDLNDAAAADR